MINILIDENIESIVIKNNIVEELVKKIFKDHNKYYSTISYIISDDQKLSDLKQNFFNQHVFTDVITFNLEDDGEPIEGEIYISLERVKENSKIFGQEFSTEFSRILIHGTLHLIGFNDETDDEKENMTNLEDKYIKGMLETIL